MLDSAEVDGEIQDKLGTVGLTKLALFTSLGKDSDKLRTFLAKPPLNLDEDKDFTAAISVAKLVSVWEAARTTMHVENELAAQRRSQNLPPKWGIVKYPSYGKSSRASTFV